MLKNQTLNCSSCRPPVSAWWRTLQMPLLLLDWRTAAPVWQDVKIIPLMLILFHYYFLVSLVLLQVSSWEYFLTTLLTWVFSLWAFASVKHLETIFYWKRQDINKTELNLSASMRRGPKAAAVVNHMGLHSHRHLRVSTLTLILMAAVSFCRLRYPVTNPERLRMRGGGGAYAFLRSPLSSHLWDVLDKQAPSESESADIPAARYHSTPSGFQQDPCLSGSAALRQQMLNQACVSSVQINMHASFPW